MEKNNLLILGALGALGIGAYFYFNKQDPGIGGGAAGGKPGSELVNPTYIFNVAAPVFPDLSSFFTDNGTTPTETVAKKDTPIIINQDDYQPGSVVIVPIKNTIPSTTGGQNFPTVIPSKKETVVPYAPSPAQPPLDLENIFGFPVVPHLAPSTPASTPTSKKATVTVPSTGNYAALNTVGTPAQQIEQYNIAPKIINGKKVM